MIMDNKIPQVPQVPSPSFPSVDLHVYDSGTCIMEFSPCQPHELSAVLALWKPRWKIEIISHVE